LSQQQYPPGSKNEFQVPDFFAVFESAAGSIPVLIEVKSKKRTLSWKPEYYESLQRYGEVVGLRVLVAWKETRSRSWSLVDISRRFPGDPPRFHPALDEARQLGATHPSDLAQEPSYNALLALA
jgi:Holliday junction resolvase